MAHLSAALHLKETERSIFLAKDNQVIAYFILSDALREDAKDTIKALRAMGKDVYVCTGECQVTADSYAAQLGIERTAIYSEYKPEQKERLIHDLRSKGHKKEKKIAMVGDAANDSLALTASDFGIAIRS